MKPSIHHLLAFAAIVALPACTLPTESSDENSLVGQAEQDGEPSADVEQESTVGTAEQALSDDDFWDWYTCYGYTTLIRHYTYSDSTGTYRWDVTRNNNTGKTWVDERRIGGGFYVQYVETPGWKTCPAAVETVSLKASGTTLTGPHNCLPNGVEEVHLEKQRELHRAATFRTCAN